MIKGALRLAAASIFVFTLTSFTNIKRRLGKAALAGAFRLSLAPLSFISRFNQAS